MVKTHRSLDPTELLGRGLADRLPLASAEIRALIERLLAPGAASRVAGLDAVLGRLLPDGEIAADAHELLPFVVPLATAPRYPESARLLVRLASFLGAIDDPPRRLAGAGGTMSARRAYDVLGAHLPALLRVAGASRDPEASRIAATLCARFPDADDRVTPALVALLSGTADPDERARLLYALVRIQASRGEPFQGRIAEALRADTLTAEKLAVSMAIGEHDPTEPLRGRVIQSLREALADVARHRDPTTWGDRLSPRRLERLLKKLDAPAARNDD